MSNDDQEETTIEDDLTDLIRLVELLDKGAANVRQLIYKLRPILRAQIKSDEGSSGSNGNHGSQGRRERRTKRT